QFPFSAAMIACEVRTASDNLLQINNFKSIQSTLELKTAIITTVGIGEIINRKQFVAKCYIRGGGAYFASKPEFGLWINI
ncbi:MAG: hypothetical protein ACR2PG_08570, partial [Hyphomicrobiaceae bacterium]